MSYSLILDQKGVKKNLMHILGVVVLKTAKKPSCGRFLRAENMQEKLHISYLTRSKRSDNAYFLHFLWSLYGSVEVENEIRQCVKTRKS